MLTTTEVNKFIKELEKEMTTCRETDQFGYAKHRACEVYKSIIKRLKQINKDVYHDVEEYYKE